MRAKKTSPRQLPGASLFSLDGMELLLGFAEAYHVHPAHDDQK